jgi:raffinose/stachyose/melibiose transport system substrate-binding protein
MDFAYGGDSTYRKSLFEGWNQAVEQDALVPYIDFASTNLIDILTADSQALVAGQLSPDQFVADVQGQYESFEP